jgi:CrcB protein
VNIVGSLALGLLAGVFLAKGETDQSVRLLLATGVLGGFTTFSAFSLDAALMWQRGDWSMLATYILGSVVLSIAAIFAGLAAARAMF